LCPLAILKNTIVGRNKLAVGESRVFKIVIMIATDTCTNGPVTRLRWR